MKAEIVTQSGKFIDLVSPTPDMICIEDIAHALSNLCRFTGHVRSFYSVAQHCVLTSYLVPPEYALQALLHDATEAYVNDIASPLKSLLPEYQRIENRFHLAITKHFGLPETFDESVHCADQKMLVREWHSLFDFHGASEVFAPLSGQHEDIVPTGSHQTRSAFIVVPMNSHQARNVFMNRFMEVQHAAA